MHLHLEDTIAAIATPVGVGAISIIRVSGPASIQTVEKIFKGKKGLSDSNSHTIHYGKIAGEPGESIDDVLVSVFRNPHSYTGEDSVEISTHGNPLITEKIIKLLINEGVRPAEPGEFTRRAYLNGRIDLAQAEAVADVISARTEASLKGARNQLDGLLSQKVDSLRSMLINTSSLIELELDFAEEDIEFVGKSELSDKICYLINEIEQLLKTYSFGKIIRDGVAVALVGKPNVGKSSLLNYMLKESRAIVSEIPGTTRDVIREEVSIDGILFRLYDTAGIRNTIDKVEKEGVTRSREAVKNADIVIFINDVEQGIDVDIYSELLEVTQKEKIITLINKIDLNHNPEFKADVYVSAKTGEGIEDLFKLLKINSLGTTIYTEKNAVVSTARHFNSLKKAKEFLTIALSSLEDNLSGEFISVDLRNAESALSEIIGIVTTDDILNNIFHNFCIGK